MRVKNRLETLINNAVLGFLFASLRATEHVLIHLPSSGREWRRLACIEAMLSEACCVPII